MALLTVLNRLLSSFSLSLSLSVCLFFTLSVFLLSSREWKKKMGGVKENNRGGKKVRYLREMNGRERERERERACVLVRVRHIKWEQPRVRERERKRECVCASACVLVCVCVCVYVLIRRCTFSFFRSGENGWRSLSSSWLRCRSPRFRFKLILLLVALCCSTTPFFSKASRGCRWERESERDSERERVREREIVCVWAPLDSSGKQGEV